MDEKRKTSLMIGGALAVIALALFLIFRTASTPGETVNKFEEVTPKGIEKAQRERQ